MIFELIHQVLIAAVTGRTVHDALHVVGFLALGVAFAAVADGLRGGEGRLECPVDFGVHDFDGLVGDVGGKAAAAFAAGLGVGLNLVFKGSVTTNG